MDIPKLTEQEIKNLLRKIDKRTVGIADNDIVIEYLGKEKQTGQNNSPNDYAINNITHEFDFNAFRAKWTMESQAIFFKIYILLIDEQNINSLINNIGAFNSMNKNGCWYCVVSTFNENANIKEQLQEKHYYKRSELQ